MDDEVKILEVLVAHFKSHGTQLNVEGIIAAVGDSLERKSIKYSDMYEKVRRLKQRYEVTTKKVEHGGDLPAKEDDLRMYQLSSEIWGKNAKEYVSAPASQNKGNSSKITRRGRLRKIRWMNATVPSIRREHVELQSLYPNLASFVKGIELQHACGSTFKRAFEFISDDKACTLESKIKKQKIAEVRMQLRLADTKKEVANALLGLLD
uniref:Glabrous enhancer-binding protein-like DBD domain-containing protein n=1 Tax=Oryza barthii TaxID=65489 RepID=A0A0D3F3R8_9ORYZ